MNNDYYILANSVWDALTVLKNDGTITPEQRSELWALVVEAVGHANSVGHERGFLRGIEWITEEREHLRKVTA